MGSLALSLATSVIAESRAPFKIISLEHLPPSHPMGRSRPLPEFVLTERSGRPISLADLRGKIWIVDFIYTQCTDTCPLQTAEMAKLQDLWVNDRDLRLVSISVDPEKDTPKILARYAARFHADTQRWLFLTGDKFQIGRLVEEGFHLPVSLAVSRRRATPIIIHSSRLILVDRDAQIRGSYDSRDRLSMQRLKTDVANLLHGSVSVTENRPSVHLRGR
jgi:protein SCO1/2